MRAFLDRILLAVLRSLPLRWRSISVIPVLHVERLYDNEAFAAVMEFCADYTQLTGRRVLATVITPAAPLLRGELQAAGFGVNAYATRLGRLAEVADIGLHGHFLRHQTVAEGPVHNYWPDSSVVKEQIGVELAWLRERRLLPKHGLSYAAGWWYLNSSVRAALQFHGFEYDFSPSRNRYNVSLRAIRGEVGQGGMPLEVWAVAGICAAGAVSSVPRHIWRMHWRELLANRPTLLSLYSHDWDIDPTRARTTLRDLSRLGIELTDLAAVRRAA